MAAAVSADPDTALRVHAREELGVEIELDAALELVPGGWDQLAPSTSFADLNSRLSMSAVTTGGITYPAAGDHEATTGELVIAQVVLTPDMPYQLLEFPQEEILRAYAVQLHLKQIARLLRAFRRLRLVDRLADLHRGLLESIFRHC